MTPNHPFSAPSPNTIREFGANRSFCCSILVVGARNSGKTSFIEFLRTSLALPARKQRAHAPAFAYPHEPSTPHDPHGRPSTASPPRGRGTAAAFVSHYLETETGDAERVGLTLWDSEGLDRAIVDLQLREVVAFLESKFEDTFGEETKVVRAPGTRDTHIHCVFLVLDPLRLDQTIKAAKAKAAPGAEAPALGARLANGRSYGIDSMSGNGPANGGANSGSGAPIGGLDEQLDLQALRALQGKTTVIPIISKADTVTAAHMGALKRAVDYSLKQAKLDPFEALGQGDDDDDDDDDDDASDVSGDASARPAHNRHNSRTFDERDEDRLRRPGTGYSPPPTDAPAAAADGAMSAHLDTSSTTTDSSGAGPAANANATVDTTPDLPLSILAPEDPAAPHTPGRGAVGRYFAWGSADPYDPAHCDFVRLRALVFEEWRTELREASREVWYEGWRTSRLNRGTAAGGSGGGGAKTVGAGAERGGVSRGARMGVRMGPGGGPGMGPGGGAGMGQRVGPGIGPGVGPGMGPGANGGRMVSGGGRHFSGGEQDGVTALPGMAR